MIYLKRLYANNFKQLQELELQFPDHARVLVQGKNEAGKSTLFEALFFALFGSALATESGARALDGLIAYEKEKARVELDLQCGARLFKIVRTIVRDKANIWELDLTKDGGVPEEVRGNNTVNKRLISELGFDGDALLNTCFVEQKKLDKLEGMSKAKREESLAKLLNLDALVALENDFKIRAEDKQELERLKKRVELAVVQDELPKSENALEAVESKLQLIDLRGAVEGAAEEMRMVQQLDAEIRLLAAQRDAAAQRAARIERLKEAMQSLKDARDALERIVENTRESERLRAEQAQTQHEAEKLSELQTRGHATRRLLSLVRRLDQIRAAREAYAQHAARVAGAETRVLALQTTVEDEEQALAELEARLRAYGIGEALGNWIAVQREAPSETQVEGEIQQKLFARERMSRRFRLEVYGLAALLLIFIAAAALAPSLALLFFALAALTLIVLAARASLLWRDLARAAEELGQALGEARVRANASAAQSARWREAQTRLAQLNVAVPETIDVAHARRVAIAREMGNKTKEELEAEYDAAHERLVNARAVLGELQRQTEIVNAAQVQEERAEAERRAQKAQVILARWEPRVQRLARSLGVDQNTDEIQRTLFQIDAQAEHIHRRASELARLKEERDRREKQTQALLARARESYEAARVVKTDVPAWSPSLTVADYNAFGKALRGEYDALGGDAAIKETREIEGEWGRREGERKTRAQNAGLLIARVQELLSEMGRAEEISSSPTQEELEKLHKKFQSIDLGDEATLRTQHREIVGRVHSLRDQQASLERDLGLAGEELDLTACRAEYEEKERAARVRERGVEIVSLARRRIVQKVLPATMDYMRQILPALTRDRYHDAQLDDESYKIQVWDERAGQGGAFKEKNIFSGGTKDQFSLALRLAFALATLPQERGSAPSFIFLDEPLGSFDDERADALIYLLTEGEIARAFDQIFLISHVHVDERLFTHRVVLENGRVAFTDLPSERRSRDPQRD